MQAAKLKRDENEILEVNMHAAEGDYVLILRIWPESGADSAHVRAWRSRINDLHTGRQFHADGMDAAFEIIRSILAEKSPSVQEPRQ